jgi:hypothetical protein
VAPQGLVGALDAELGPQACDTLAAAYGALGILPEILAQARALPAPYEGAQAEPSDEALAARWTRHARRGALAASPAVGAGAGDAA